jgi:hypothetical protein
MKTTAMTIIGILGLGAGALTAHGAESAKSKRVEFDFSGLPDKKLRVGDKIKTEHGTIEMEEFTMAGGNPSQADEAQAANPVQTTFAKGSAPPELRMYLINARVRPNAPVRKVVLKFAQTAASGLVNIQVDGDHRVGTHGLQGFHNQVIGGARVTVRKNPATGVNFPGGELELEAIDGKFRNFGVGGLVFLIDDVRLVK